MNYIKEHSLKGEYMNKKKKRNSLQAIPFLLLIITFASIISNTLKQSKLEQERMAQAYHKQFNEHKQRVQTLVSEVEYYAEIGSKAGIDWSDGE